MDVPQTSTLFSQQKNQPISDWKVINKDILRVSYKF